MWAPVARAGSEAALAHSHVCQVMEATGASRMALRDVRRERVSARHPDLSSGVNTSHHGGSVPQSSLSKRYASPHTPRRAILGHELVIWLARAR